MILPKSKEIYLSVITKISAGVTTNSATATNCVSLYDLRGIPWIKLIPNPNLLRRLYLARVLMA